MAGGGGPGGAKMERLEGLERWMEAPASPERCGCLACEDCGGRAWTVDRFDCGHGELDSACECESEENS